MARPNGLIICGFEDTTDPRNFVPDCIRPFTPGLYDGGFQLDGDTTFKFVWRWAQLHYDFNISWGDGISTAGISASGDFVAAWLFGHPAPDEGSIPCQTEIIYAIRELGTPDGTAMDFQMQLGEFNEISELFLYGVRGGFSAFAQPSPTVSFGVPSGPPSGVICTVLGENVPIYDVVGSASGNVTITIAPLNGYWEWDDGIGGGAPHGPIWDKDTGDQLITPIPTS